MVVALVLGMPALAVAAGWWAVVALVGRSSFPRRERLPLRRWRPADLLANVRRGLAQLEDLQAAVGPPAR